MISSLLAWPLTILAFVFMLPWARWLSRDSSERLLIAVTTLALSIGTLSLVMLWIGLVSWRLDWRLAAILCAAISVTGWIAWRRSNPPAVIPSTIAENGLSHLVIVMIAVIAALILFNAVYWPFGIDDSITIYAWFGKVTALTSQLPRGSLYETYPMLVPLSYAFTHQAAGWIDEHLAALIPAMLSIAVIGVAYLLGQALYNRIVGLIAALLIVLTPMYTHWASAGYVDLPTAFFYGLTGLFLLRLDRSQRWSDALLSGIMAGLAAWTKNSGLLIVISVAGWLLLRRWQDRRAVSFRQMIIVAGGFLAVAGPWYARNLALAGVIVPPTNWTWKAEHSLRALVPYLTDSRYFPIGWLFTAGLLFMFWQLFRSRGQDKPSGLLAIFYVPFFVIWFALVSYDDRFLLAVTPFLAVMGAHFVVEIWTHLPYSMLLPRWATIALIAVLLPLAVSAASAAVDYKLDILRHPLMSDVDKHRLRLGERYDVALHLRTLPTGSRILTQDLLMPYYADGVQMTVGGWPLPDQLSAYDYWLLSPGAVLPDWFAHIDPVYSQGGYELYPISH